MNLENLKQRHKNIIAEFGEWTNHNIQIQEDFYTIDKAKITGAEVKLKRYLQIISDIVRQPFSQLRVLDLACLEGIYGIEMALQGAEVVGIEGRQANIEKARFTKESLGLNNLNLYLDDVRNLSRAKYGEFDIVLCLGIFYHLDAPDVFAFMESIAEVCKYLAIVDTHVSMSAETSYIYKLRQYTGRSYIEHNPETNSDEKIKFLWSSLDNNTSFWLTRPSFYNLFTEVGFTSVYECHNPPVRKYEIMRERKETDRATFVAIKGQPTKVLASTMINQLPQEFWPEK